MAMMGKMKETQENIEATKAKLDGVLLEEQSSDGLLKVVITANSTIKSITIDDQLHEDKEQLEDYLVITLNKAIQSAISKNQSEIDAVAKVDMPMIPGMEDLFKL